MPKFMPGDKVIAIENSYILKRGREYTIAETSSAGDQQTIMLLENDNWYTALNFYKSTEKPNYVDEGLVMPTASKNDKDKIDLSLIPAVSMREHAKAFMVGEKKYGRYNYAKGHKASQLVAAAMRHLTAWFEREEHDPIDGQHHLGSVMACCSMILRQIELNTLKDDRFEDENNRKK